MSNSNIKKKLFIDFVVLSNNLYAKTKLQGGETCGFNSEWKWKISNLPALWLLIETQCTVYFQGFNRKSNLEKAKTHMMRT